MIDEERAEVGEAWRRQAIGEHASVAAFARFVLHLMRLGAPPELLLDAIRAMEDEVFHARLCFAIAARLTGEAVGPGELDLTSVLDSDEPARILEAAIVEGCINETIAVRCAEVAGERAEDPEIRQVLARIVADETRHTDLSWRFVAWMLSKYPALVPMAEACFAQAIAPVPPMLDSAGDEEPAFLERWGHLVARSRAEVRDQVIRDVIRPRSAALFGASA